MTTRRDPRSRIDATASPADGPADPRPNATATSPAQWWRTASATVSASARASGSLDPEKAKTTASPSQAPAAINRSTTTQLRTGSGPSGPVDTAYGLPLTARATSTAT